MLLNKIPNILIVITDQQRFDTLSCYGNQWIHTPNLNRLAEESFVFKNAYVTQPVCTPSRSSILTGLYPHTNGLVRNGISLNKETKTIAELVSSEYSRIYHGKWHLGNDSKPQHGFEKWVTTHYPELREKESSDYHKWVSSMGVEFPNYDVRPGGDGSASQYAVFQANLPEQFSQASYIGDVTASALLDLGSDDSFLMVANFFEPHPPYSGPLNGLYNPKTIPVGPGFLNRPKNVSEFHISRSDYYLKGNHRSDSVAACDGYDLSKESGWRELRSNYMANVTLVDKNIGRILDALSRSGKAEDTIVVFTSDHGDMLGDHGMLEKRSFYEESAKVPLLIKIPWLSQTQKIISGNISQIDILPTLLDLIGGTIPSYLEGYSRVNVLMGEQNLEENDVFIQWNGVGDRDLGNDTINRMNSIARICLVTGDRWKLSLGKGDNTELFDLNSDPYEIINRATDKNCSKRIELMEQKIYNWKIKTNCLIE